MSYTVKLLLPREKLWLLCILLSVDNHTQLTFQTNEQVTSKNFDDALEALRDLAKPLELKTLPQHPNTSHLFNNIRTGTNSESHTLELYNSLNYGKNTHEFSEPKEISIGVIASLIAWLITEIITGLLGYDPAQEIGIYLRKNTSQYATKKQVTKQIKHDTLSTSPNMKQI